MKRSVKWLCAALVAALLCGCTLRSAPTTTAPKAEEEADLNLAISDTYDLQAMGCQLTKLTGEAVTASGNVLTAVAEGTAQVTVTCDDQERTLQVRVFANAQELGGRFSVDKGMFHGKNVIVFGDSITDGYLLDPMKPRNYDDTYFAKLCEYLGAATDPTDRVNCNFALGGTQISSGHSAYGISGAERMERVEPFYEDGTKRDIRPAILSADLCVIYYGTNDLVFGKLAQASNEGWVTDTPRKASDAQTVSGALYFMINMLRSLNPNIKILVLPPVLRRADGQLLVYSEDKTDVLNCSTGQSIRQYGDVMETVCLENGAKFVDWGGVFTYENFCKESVNTYSTDGLHPNAAGHELMFNYLLGLLTQEEQ